MIIDNSELVKLIAELKTVNKETVSITAATSLIGAMRTRIHEEGKASDGSQIGTYSDGYMKVRTGDFGTSARFSRGKSKGEVKNAGTFTKGKDKGQPRPNYNRTNDKTVILSLTRQQENDLSVVEVSGVYGVGYKNELNAKKADWEEETYKKKIFDPTQDEIILVEEAVNELLKNAIS